MTRFTIKDCEEITFFLQKDFEDVGFCCIFAHEIK